MKDYCNNCKLKLDADVLIILEDIRGDIDG